MSSPKPPFPPRVSAMLTPDPAARSGSPNSTATDRQSDVGGRADVTISTTVTAADGDVYRGGRWPPVPTIQWYVSTDNARTSFFDEQRPILRRQHQHSPSSTRHRDERLSIRGRLHQRHQSDADRRNEPRGVDGELGAEHHAMLPEGTVSANYNQTLGRRQHSPFTLLAVNSFARRALACRSPTSHESHQRHGSRSTACRRRRN